MDSQDEADNSPFAYGSRAWRDLDPTVCYLTEQHRQTDTEFSSLLAAICSSKPLRQSRSRPPCQPPSSRKTAFRAASRGCSPTIWMWTASTPAEFIKLPGDANSYHHDATGDKLLADGLKRGCLSPERLDLKMGAVVMFTKNDPDGRFVNGTLGVVSGFDTEDGNPIVVTQDGPTVLRQTGRMEGERGRNRASAGIGKSRCGWPGRSPCTRARACRSTRP